jgi:hypothetical protein
MPIDEPARKARSPWVQPLFGIVALVVVLLQMGWSYHCIHGETFASTDPGRDTEAFLARNFPGKRIAGFAFESVSTQAYAQRNLFFNQPHAFWVWSVNVWTDRRRTEALEQHPDIVVAGDLIFRDEYASDQWLSLVHVGSRPDSQMLQFWQQHGYRITHQFCGDRFSRLGVDNTFCEDILEPTQQPVTP